jgi:hypothetical protein
MILFSIVSARYPQFFIRNEYLRFDKSVRYYEQVRKKNKHSELSVQMLSFNQINKGFNLVKYYKAEKIKISDILSRDRSFDFVSKSRVFFINFFFIRDRVFNILK